MNFQDPIKEIQSEDVLLAKKATQFFKMIEQKIALKSFDGARNILESSYAMVLLGEENITFLRSEIEKAETNYKKDGNKIYWEWSLIFVFATFISAYMIWRFGILESVIKMLRATSRSAKAIIGTAVFTIVGAIGVAFTYLCKILKDLKNKIFG